MSHPVHDTERRESSPHTGEDNVVQQLITTLGNLRTPSPQQAAPVSVQNQGVRVEFAGKLNFARKLYSNALILYANVVFSCVW